MNQNKSMPRRVKNLIGQRFGRLVVTDYAGLTKHNMSMWATTCDCGNSQIVTGNHLRQGNTKSCGCLNDEVRAMQCVKRSTKHGFAKRKQQTKEYVTWCNMIARTENEARQDFRFYGAKGVKVCERWRTSFENFYTDMGNKPDGMTIDRIDPTGDYSPDNCRWATWEVQHQNTRSVLKYEVFGEVLTLKEMSVKYGKTISSLKQRISKLGMSPEEAVVATFIGKGKNSKVIYENN